MNDNADELTCRVLINFAATQYLHLLHKSDPHSIAFLSDVYKTGDIREWARQRIKNVLSQAREIQTRLSSDQLTSVRDAVAQHAEQLEQAGFQCWNVRPVGGMKTEQPSFPF